MAEVPKTWEEIHSLDDIVSPEERAIVQKTIEYAKRRCPFLRKDGEHFHYCGTNISPTRKPTLQPNDPIYRAHVDTAELQLWCLGNYETCSEYQGSQSPADKKNVPK